MLGFFLALLPLLLVLAGILFARQSGALKTIADAIKRVARTWEEQALFIGMGFG